jgi:hypothetical protein
MSDAPRARGITPEVEECLRDTVQSFEQLAALLLLRQSPEREWRASDVATELRMTRSEAERALLQLEERGLLRIRDDETTRGWAYRPATPRLAAVIDAVAIAYDEHPLDVMRLMNKLSIARIRSAALRTFADAFLIRRNKDG